MTIATVTDPDIANKLVDDFRLCNVAYMAETPRTIC